MSVGRPPLTVWVRDEGQQYALGQYVDWTRDGEHWITAHPRGAYVVERAAPDPAMAPERWLKVQLRRL